MEAEVMRHDLQDKIAHADQRQLKEIYGLVTNYLNGHDDEREWQSLSEPMKAKLAESIKQADAGLGREMGEVLNDMRKKFGLNG